MEENIMLLTVITFIVYFVVGNPYTYAIVSKVTGLKVKNKTHHMILVGIHSVVMTILMYIAYSVLIKDKECPPPRLCPPAKDTKKDTKDTKLTKDTKSTKDTMPATAPATAPTTAPTAPATMPATATDPMPATANPSLDVLNGDANTLEGFSF